MNLSIIYKVVSQTATATTGLLNIVHFQKKKKFFLLLYLLNIYNFSIKSFNFFWSIIE